VNNGRARSILLVEDDDGHARLLEKHLDRCGLGDRLVRVADGEEAIRYLGNTRTHAGSSSFGPGLILLDIQMPRCNGFEVLTRIREDPAYQHTPVIMLTSTDSQKEIDQAYRLGASGYVVKPVDAFAFAERVAKLGGFLGVLELPDQLPVGTTDGQPAVG